MSINNCKHLHIAAKKVIKRFLSPHLGDIGAPRPMDEILIKLDDNINNKGILIGMVTIITKDILKENIVGPSKYINLINSFGSTLKREMGPMSRDLVSYEVSLE
jgi:hypothetical protein